MHGRAASWPHDSLPLFLILKNHSKACLSIGLLWEERGMESEGWMGEGGREREEEVDHVLA